jgi:radical SAM protein with 4Fe4S-binding SPASM domain
MIDYFKQHNVGYYIGFDGVKQSNDRNRRFGDSNNSAFDISLDNIRKIIGRGVNPEHIFLNLVIADNNVEYLLDDVVFISSLARGIRLSINVAYNCKWDQRSLGVLDKSLRGLLDFYERETSADGRYSIKFIDERIGRLLYPRQGKPSEMCGAANGCLTVLTDGNITGCATLAYCRKDDADIVLGNVSEGIDSRRKTSFRDSIDAIEHGECKECAFFGVCANYCVANNLVGSGTMTKIPRSICETEKVIDHRFAEIIERWKRERPQFLLSRFGNNVGRSQHTA